MTIRYIALLLPLILVGCATNPTEDTKTTQEEAKLTCERTYRVGSMMPSKDCAPPMSQEDRQHLQDELQKTIHPTASTSAKGV